MKNMIKYLALAAVAFGSVSCEDFLDIPSETKFDSSSIFETTARAEMAVLAAYHAGYNREMWYQLGMGTDEVISTEGDTNSKNQIANYLMSGSVTGSSTYTASYSAIEYANVCIRGIEGMAQTSENLRLLGEAYAIRAAAFLNVVRFWGDVPYPTIPVAEMESFSSSRVSRDEILDGCVEDLQKATELIPWKSEISNFTPERYCKESAYGILARVALYAAGYSLRWDLNTVPYNAGTLHIAKRDDAARVKELNKIAADACEQVISRKSFSLSDSYEQIFRDLLNKEYNQESMLEQGQYGTNVNVETGYTNGMFCHTSSIFGKAQPAMMINPTLYFDYGEGDTRRDVAICEWGVDNNSKLQLLPYGSFRIGKFRAAWKSEIGTAINKRDINWPWLRYSHILLMYAEALNEYNGAPTDAAKNALREIRLRAYNNDATKIGTIPSDYDSFLKAIIEENKLEFAGEAWRRTELCRWGIHYETLMQNKQDQIDLAACTPGTRFENIDRYRAYKPKDAEFKEPSVGVELLQVKAFKDKQLTYEQIEELQAEGYTVVDMHNNKGAANVGLQYATAAFSVEKVSDSNGGEQEHQVYKGSDGFSSLSWYTSLFRGLEKNKTELCPLSQTAVIDVNPGLRDQQHPGY